ncbi:MAG: ABC transporter ATP-binding protein [Zavarzinia sp.]|nr:ABC transporter ATP-binding protein [Zavarzinia sp.]
MSPLIILDGVTVSRGGRRVLDSANLRLEAGERLALVGPNGAGKTTLLRTLIGLEKAEAGTITAFGAERRTERDFRPVRARAGFLFQDADDQLFCPTAIDDVAFGPLNLGLSAKAAAEKARAVLERLHLSHLAHRITHHLSGGEKRLVALAGVLAMDPEVLLLDEPTNALDDVHYGRLNEILANLPVAMIIVSHDRRFLHRLSSRVVALQGGRLHPAAFHSHPHTHDHLHIHLEGGEGDHRH